MRSLKRLMALTVTEDVELSTAEVRRSIRTEARRISDVRSDE